MQGGSVDGDKRQRRQGAEECGLNGKGLKTKFEVREEVNNGDDGSRISGLHFSEQVSFESKRIIF